MSILQKERTASVPHAVARESSLPERDFELQARIERRRAEVLSQGGWPSSDPLYQRLWGVYARISQQPNSQ